MTAYYNENDPYAAQWLRNLVTAGRIAPGDVDDRSIKDVRADDLIGYQQCHFFAGIGVWSYALRQSGWPDDRSVWTGSCPCQPFSAIGQRQGADDTRHLWPDWVGLIAERAPDVVFGEQVASKDGEAWLDTVQADMEGLGYAFGPIVSPAAGYGAPHGRHRIYFVGDSERARLERYAGNGNDQARRQIETGSVTETSSTRKLEHANGTSNHRQEPSSGKQSIRDERDNSTVTVEHSESEQERISRFARERRATGGYWSDADWIPCRGGTRRAIEPGTFPLANGVACRMDKIRAYGNAICAPQASEFVTAYMDTVDSFGHARELGA